MLRTLPALLVLALSFRSASASPPSGLLLGQRTADESRYHTLWIYDAGQQIRIVVVPDLLLPRENGFWRIGGYRTLETLQTDEELDFPRQNEKFTIEESDIWLAPLRQTPSIVLTPNQELTTHHLDWPCESTDREITFVNPTHIWYRADSDVACGVHPDRYIKLYAAPLESLLTRLKISQILGESGVEAYHQAVAAAWRKANKEAGFECEPTEDPSNWNIARGRGKWKVTGWADTHRLCGYGLDLEIPIELPPSITGYDRLLKPWTELEAEIPGLLDAFSSPTNGLLVATTKEAVMVYRPQRAKIGPPVVRYPVLADTAVMAQWAVGARSVARWTKEVESTREVHPLVRHRGNAK